MTSYPIQTLHAFSQDLLTTPSATQPTTIALGQVIEVIDSSAPNAVKRFMLVKSHAALTQYQPYTVVFSNTSGSEVITAAPAILASGATIVVPQVAFTSGYYGLVQIFGQCTVKLANETHVAGDYLKLQSSGTTLLVDGTSGSTSYSTLSIARQIGTLSGAGTTSVFLFGSLRSAVVQTD